MPLGAALSARDIVLWITGLLLALMLGLGPASADGMRTYVKRGTSYEDVKLDVEMAIEGKGLKVGSVGDLGDMLARTRADVGGGTAVYKAAHYYEFCAASLAHKFATADPGNIGYCPLLLFSYETVDTPGDVVVGYRSLARSGSALTQAVLDEAEALLDTIARAAVK